MTRQERRLIGTLFTLALLAWAGVAPAGAKPILFPPTPNGPAEWRDERDVAPFLAAWKAEGLRRARHMAVSATPNQLAYDVSWYDLDLTFNPAGAQVSGTVRVRAKVLAGPLSTLDLDLNAGLGVTAVQSAGSPATFSRPGDLLTVNLDRRTYSPILRQADIPDTTIPWWGNRTLHFEYN